MITSIRFAFEIYYSCREVHDTAQMCLLRRVQRVYYLWSSLHVEWCQAASSHPLSSPS
jgi:hypothetical protein